MSSYTLPDGTEIFFVRKGAGRKVLLLHGVWGSSSLFSKQVDALSERCEVTAIDFRGHGLSTKTNVGHTVVQYAQDLRAFILGTNTRDVLLIGWSMGAFVAWQYLMNFGEDGISGLVVVDQSASDFQWVGWDYGIVDMAGLQGIMELIQTDRAVLADTFVRSMFYGKPNNADIALFIGEACRIPEPLAGCIFFDQVTRDYRSCVGRWSVPTLLCFGRAASPFPVEAGMDLAERITGAQLTVFERSGHCPFWEEADEFNRVVLQFLDACELRA